MAVSLASRSDHPVSKAVAESQQARTVTIQAVDAFEALLGRGVKGRIDGQLYYLGNHRLIEELKLCGSALEARLALVRSGGASAIVDMDLQPGDTPVFLPITVSIT